MEVRSQLRRAADLCKLLAEELVDLSVLVPLLVVLISYALGVVFAPDIDTNDQHAHWTSFFSTAAQVMATLLLVLALEGRWAARTHVFSKLGGAILTVIYVAIGLAASGAALSPSLSDDVYCQLFAITLAAGVGALLSVALIGIRVLTIAYAERDVDLRRKVDEIYAALGPIKPPPRP